MVPPLHWESQDDNTKRAKIRPLTWFLLAGAMPLVTLRPLAKHYELYCPLPGVAFHKSHLPLEEAKRAAELAVERWFKACYPGETT